MTELTALSPELFAHRAEWKKQDVAAAARQFEALLVSQWLKAARQAGEPLAQESEMTGSENYYELAEQQMAEAIARKGTLGLARMMLREVEPPAPAGDAGPTRAATIREPPTQETL